MVASRFRFRSVSALVLALSLPGAAFAAEKPAPAAKAAAKKATPPPPPKPSYPLRFDVGGFLGVSTFDDGSGLGNATDPKDVPQGGFGIGAHAGVVVLDGHLGVEGQLRTSFGELRSGKGSATVIGYRLHALWYPVAEGPVLPFLTVGLGQDVLATGKSQCPAPPVVPPAGCIYVKNGDNDDVLALGLGARITLAKRLGLRAQLLYLNAEPRPAGVGIPAGDRNHNLDVNLGLVYTIGGPPDDADKDGIPDERDRCPKLEEDRDGFEDGDGCPELDNDSDGIADLSDKCPNEDEDPDGFEDKDGCPDPDNDNDGILDLMDKCPNAPETKNGVDDDDGCPDEADKDGDGIVGAADKCPTVAEDKDGFEDLDGCPESDNDKDGLEDAKDKCPNDAEVVNGLEDTDGCPDALPAAVAAVTGKPLALATFKDTKLLSGHEAALEPLIAFLVEQETIRLAVAVLPETDTDAGRTQAQARAAALVAWMIDLGVDAARLQATTLSGAGAAESGKGKGSSRPSIQISIQ